MRVRWTWPVAAVRGSASTTSTRRGCLNGASRPAQNVAQRRRRRGRSAPGAHTIDRGHDLAPLRIGHADDRDLGDRRVLAEHLLDLGRRDRLAAGADHVARPADDREVAVVVDRAEIAGVVPAVAERVGGRLGRVEVAVHEERAAQAHLAGVGRASRRRRLAARRREPGLRNRSASPSCTPGPASVEP